MNKKRFIIGSIGIFLAFTAMLVLVSVNSGAIDLKVSQRIGQLAQDNRYSSNLFANAIAAFGELPMYLGALWVFASAIYVLRSCGNAAVRNTVSIVLGILMVKTGDMACNNCTKYMLRHGWITNNNRILNLVFGVMLAMGMLFLLLKLKPDPKATLQFAIVAALMIGISQFLIHIVLKSFFSRERFRAIAYLSGDFSQFTPWYRVNHLVSLPAKAIADDFRSFPSGHTASAGTLYLLMLVPFYYKEHSNAFKITCLVLPVLLTGLVAVGRIVAGAHYFSDVLFGGSISFTCVWALYLIQQKLLHHKIFED